MTPAELLKECERSELFSAQYGHASNAIIVLQVHGLRKGETAQIVPGLRGRVVGHGPTSTMVQVTTSEVRAWLKRRGLE